MTKFEEEYLEETLLSCLREFEELEEQHSWFTTLCINRINKALKMLRKHNPESKEFAEAMTQAFQEGVQKAIRKRNDNARNS